jgi:hypothetical protein
MASPVAIKDSLFAAVGEDREILALAGPDTKRIDLKDDAREGPQLTWRRGVATIGLVREVQPFSAVKTHQSK